MSRICPGLFLGGKVHAEDIEFLKEEHISGIVSCCNRFEFGNIVGIEAEQIRVDVEDVSAERILYNFHDVYAFILKHLQRPKEQGGVLVHCKSGVSRSATIVIAFMMKSRKMSLRDSFLLTINKRPCICPNIGFMRQLCDFEEELVAQDNLVVSPGNQAARDQIISDLPQDSDGPDAPQSFGLPPPAECALPQPAVGTSGASPPGRPTGCSTGLPTSSSFASLDSMAGNQNSPRIPLTTTSAPAMPNIARLRALGQSLMQSQYQNRATDSKPVDIRVSTVRAPAYNVSPSNNPGLNCSHSVPSLTSSERKSRTRNDLLTSGLQTLQSRRSLDQGTPGSSQLSSGSRSSPSLCMNKYISWYTAHGKYRPPVPSLAP